MSQTSAPTAKEGVSPSGASPVGASPRSTRQLLDELDALMNQMLALPVEDDPSQAATPVKTPTLAATLTMIEPERGDEPSAASSFRHDKAEHYPEPKLEHAAASTQGEIPITHRGFTTPPVSDDSPAPSSWTARLFDITPVSPEMLVDEEGSRTEQQLAQETPHSDDIEPSTSSPVATDSPPERKSERRKKSKRSPIAVAAESVSDSPERPLDREDAANDHFTATAKSPPRFERPPSRPMPASTASWTYRTLIVWDRGFRRLTRRGGFLGWLLRTAAGRVFLGLVGLAFWSAALAWLVMDWLQWTG